MFSHNSKKTRLNQTTKPLDELIKIESSSFLLNTVKRQTLLDNLFNASGLEESRYGDLCLSLIKNVVNQCQQLPVSTNQYYAAPGGFVDHILNRTEAAVHLLRQHLVQGEQEELSEEQKLWMYALLSAGILQGIGKLQTDYELELYDSNGGLIKKWRPILDDLPVVGSYYLYTYLAANDDELRCRFNLILAYKLMPLNGLIWIVSNDAVLATWLALLDEDTDSVGTLSILLERAEHIASQRYVNEFVTVTKARNTNGRVNRTGSFLDVAPETAEEMLKKDSLIGATFIQWLQQKLNDGDIVINQAHSLVISEGGLLVSEKLFKQFAQEHVKYKNWQAIQRAFLNWNQQNIHTTLINQNHAKETLNNLVVNTVVLPNDVQIYDVKTDKTTTVSAVVVEQMIRSNLKEIKPINVLSQKGQWEVVEKTMPWMSAGMKPRGA